MSETEHFTGKLKQIYCDLPLEEACKKIAEENRLELPTWASNYQDYLEDYFYKCEYVFAHGKAYKILKISEIDYSEDIFQAEKDGDIINFTVRYYNGGCGFSEALEYALKSIKDDQ